MTRRAELAWVAAATALAALLRFHALGVESLWLDEGYALRVARSGVRAILAGAAHETHPPLYYLLLHAWVGVFGPSEAAARAFSALAGTLTVPLAWHAARRMLGPAVAVAGAMLLALSTFHLHYSQEVRSYALLALLATLSWRFALDAAEHGRARDLAAVALAGIALVYTHHVGWFVIAGQNLALASRLLARGQRRVLVTWLLSQTAIVLAFLPWAGLLAHQVSLAGAWTWVPRPSARVLASSVVEFAGTKAGAALMLLGALIGLLAPLREPPAPGARAALAGWWLGPIALPAAVALVGPPVYMTKATIAAAVPFALLAARGALLLRPRVLAWGAFAALVALTAWPVPDYFQGPHRERWREVARDLEDAARPGDLVLFDGGFCLANAYRYYSRRGDLLTRPLPPVSAPGDTAALAGELRLASSRPRVWLVRSHDGAAGERALATLAATHRLAWSKGYESRTYELWRRRMYRGVAVDLFERR